MSGLSFTAEAAKRLEDLYMTADVVAQRSYALQKLRLRPGQAVVDIGCGPGFLCDAMAGIVGASGRIRGIDLSSDLIERSADRNPYPWASFRVGDATALDEPDESFDVVTCAQVAEYVPDVDKVLCEAYRVLEPGGRALFVATDWDGVIWHSDEPERMAAVMKSWEGHCAHPRLPRTLAWRMESAGFTVEDASIFPILNLSWSDDSYSKGIAGFIRAYVAKRAELPGDLVAAWADELPRLSENHRYFFSSGRFVVLASKPHG
jgi:ubiquinone/menaquinone biosynthesis C-methylase UbiE